MDAELGPGPHLEQLVHGADAAGERNEPVGELRHERLAFEHPVHRVQLGDALVEVLAQEQIAGDHADDPTAGGERGIRHRTHHPSSPAAVDECDATRRRGRAESAGGLQVRGLPTLA